MIAQLRMAAVAPAAGQRVFSKAISAARRVVIVNAGSVPTRSV